MAKKGDHTTGPKKRITLLDVIVHMDHMKQEIMARLSTMEMKIDRLEARIDRLEIRMERLEGRMMALEKRMEELTRRVIALEEDLMATMMDTVKIRSHVGMHVPDADD